MGGAEVVVGLDNGLLHLAACTPVKIVAGYTTVKPAHRMPYRVGELGYKVWPVVPDLALKCRYCQSKAGFVYKFDFRSCYYGDYECTINLSADKYIKKIGEALDAKI